MKHMVKQIIRKRWDHGVQQLNEGNRTKYSKVVRTHGEWMVYRAEMVEEWARNIRRRLIPKEIMEKENSLKLQNT